MTYLAIWIAFVVFILAFNYRAHNNDSETISDDINT